MSSENELDRLLENISFTSLKEKAMIVQLYKDLKFAKSVEPLEIHHAKELNLVYIVGKVFECPEVFIPVAMDESITMNRFSNLYPYLNEKHQCNRLTLALMEADSTTVFFCVTPGLLPPTEVSTRSQECITAIEEESTEYTQT